MAEVTTEVKKKFALLWLQYPDAPFNAATKLFANPTDAYIHANQLVTDPDVLAEVQRLKQETDEDALLPSKASYAREILLYARSLRNSGPLLAKDAVAYDNLYASIRGHVEKPGSNTQTPTNLTVNRVMVTNHFGSKEEYAVTLEAQQAALMHDNADDTITERRNTP